jgi:hypothetical protein
MTTRPSPAVTAFVAIAAGLMWPGCDCSGAQRTSVVITATYADSVVVDHLTFEMTTSPDGAFILPPTTETEDGGRIKPPVSLDVFVSTDAGTAFVTVDGILNRERVASGINSVLLQSGQQAQVTVHVFSLLDAGLDAGAADSGTTDAGCPGFPNGAACPCTAPPDAGGVACSQCCGGSCHDGTCCEVYEQPCPTGCSSNSSCAACCGSRCGSDGNCCRPSGLPCNSSCSGPGSCVSCCSGRCGGNSLCCQLEGDVCVCSSGNTCSNAVCCAGLCVNGRCSALDAGFPMDGGPGTPDSGVGDAGSGGIDGGCLPNDGLCPSGCSKGAPCTGCCGGACGTAGTCCQLPGTPCPSPCTAGSICIACCGAFCSNGSTNSGFCCLPTSELCPCAPGGSTNPIPCSGCCKEMCLPPSNPGQAWLCQ